MSDENKQVSDSVVDEGVPTPTFTQSASPTSNVDELAKKVAELLTPTIDSKVKSLQDKRFSTIEKKLGSLEELEQLGATIPESVKTEYRNRELNQRLEEIEKRTSSSPQTNSQGSGKVEASEWSKIIEEAELDLKDPGTIELLRGEYRNIDHFTAEALRLRDKVKSQPKPTIDTAPSLNGRKAAPESVEAETENYKKEMRANVGRANASKRQEIKNKYSKLGVNIHDIDFT